MAEIIPEETLDGMSSYDLALLLLPAYMHDIGMAPEHRKVSRHYGYVLTGLVPSAEEKDGDHLGENEIANFQRWLDNDQRGVNIPIAEGKPTAENLALANELITYYCREKHVEWGEEWIRRNLSHNKDEMYSAFIDDLVLLCASHHMGKQELLGHPFHPRHVGSPSQIVHLRYLACVLRVADVLEFDPERTPDVVLRHRGVSPQSLIYWHKDHEISFLKENGRISISARPTSARIHRAIEETISQINDELALCRALADETHFENCPGLQKDLPHQWALEPKVYSSITPRDDSYVPIDGAFRPNTRKLLELLSGIQLYGEPMVAVRELLQNALDAVKERIAYQILATNPQDKSLEKSIRATHKVELRLERRGDEVWLICTDTGVGMSRKIITDYLLVSGQARRHDVLELERRCNKAGIPFDRTGQFGIGVLSYFMFADCVRIFTRRSQETNDAESSGWFFETEGVGSFGELRRDPRVKPGTRVEMRMKKDFTEDVSATCSRLEDYLRAVLAFLPCGLEFSTTVISPARSWKLEPGWSQDLKALFLRGLLKRMGNPFHGKAADFLTDARRSELELKERGKQLLIEDAVQRMRWEVREGVLEGGIGTFRMSLPYFLMDGQVSLAYLQTQKAQGERIVELFADGGHMLTPKCDDRVIDPCMDNTAHGLLKGSSDASMHDHRRSWRRLSRRA